MIEQFGDGEFRAKVWGYLTEVAAPLYSHICCELGWGYPPEMLSLKMLDIMRHSHFE